MKKDKRFQSPGNSTQDVDDLIFPEQMDVPVSQR